MTGLGDLFRAMHDRMEADPALDGIFFCTDCGVFIAPGDALEDGDEWRHAGCPTRGLVYGIERRKSPVAGS